LATSQCVEKFQDKLIPSKTKINLLKKIFVLLVQGTIIHLPLNTERLQKLTENYVVSNAKIKSALGVKKMPVRANEGFRKTVESFMK